MNRSQRLREMMNMPDIVYSPKTGLKLLRYGELYNRFDSSSDLHYNDAPEKRGTWASIFPYQPFFHTPEHSDSKRKLDFHDQTAKTKVVYKNIENNLFLKPITFFWRFNIYSHINKTGSYDNKGWTYYHTTDELVTVLRANYSKLQKSVTDVQLSAVNNSDTRYFRNHEFEVFVPHESLTSIKREH